MLDFAWITEEILTMFQFYIDNKYKTLDFNTSTVCVCVPWYRI